MNAKYEHIHLFVSGRVQGVGYRQAAFRKASELGVAGWVRNLPDSRVELVAEGPADKIEELRQWCARGPRLARVDTIEVADRREIEAPGAAPFEIR